jgi:hypothetical protein
MGLARPGISQSQRTHMPHSARPTPASPGRRAVTSQRRGAPRTTVLGTLRWLQYCPPTRMLGMGAVADQPPVTNGSYAPWSMRLVGAGFTCMKGTLQVAAVPRLGDEGSIRSLTGLGTLDSLGPGMTCVRLDRSDARTHQACPVVFCRPCQRPDGGTAYGHARTPFRPGTKMVFVVP